jgi:hypothetical protein
MISSSKRLSFPALAALALVAAGCSYSGEGQIPCVDNSSCPSDYPVCGSAGKCVAGTAATSSVAITGVDGHAATDYLSGTVRVLVSARATSGVRSVTLASGSVNFPASTVPAASPLYAFDVNTTALTDGDATLTATLTAGDNSGATATGTLHVDNAKPVITSFTASGGPSTTITAGTTALLGVSFTPATASATITSGNGGGSITLTSSGSALVSPDVTTAFTLRVTSRSGVTVQSGTTGQPPDVTVSVVQPVSFTGNFTVTPNVIQQGPASGNFTFSVSSLGSSVVSAVVKDAANITVGTFSGSPPTAQVAIPATAPGTTQLSYTAVISNAASTPDTISVPLVVNIGAPPTITVFTGATTITSGSSAALSATFAGGSGVLNPGNIPILSGGTVLVAPSTTTAYTLTVTNATTSASVSSGTGGQPSNVTVTVVPPPVIDAFSADTVHTSSAANVTLSISTTGVTGNASVTGTCSPSGTISPFTITLSVSTGSGSSIRTVPTAATQTVCTYKATVQNAATATAQATVVVTVEPLPTITSFVFQATGSNAPASFALGSDVVLAHTYNAQGGTASINGVTPGVGTTTFPNIRFDTAFTLTVTNLAGTPVTQTLNAKVAPGSWSALNTATSEVRRGATVTALDNGKVLIAGGMDATNPNPVPSQTARLCDATGACVSKTMGTPRAFHTAVKVGSGPNAGKVLLTGGYTAAGPATPTSSAEFYDPGADAFASTTGITTGTVTAARARHIAVFFNTTTILIAGGTDGATNLNTAIKYDINTATPTTANVSTTMAQPRANFTGTLLGSGSVLIVGGKTGTTAADLTAELFAPSTGNGTFSDTGVFPSGEDKRSHTAVLIGGMSGNAGKVLVSGGVTGAAAGTPSITQFLYGGGAFTAIADLGTARSNHAALSLSAISSSNDTVLICGGTSTGSDTLSSCERYDPAVGTGTQVPTDSMLEGRKDFGLAPITISSIVEILAGGGTPAAPSAFAETYNAN